MLAFTGGVRIRLSRIWGRLRVRIELTKTRTRAASPFEACLCLSASWNHPEDPAGESGGREPRADIWVIAG